MVDASLNLRQLEILEELVGTPSWYAPPNDRHGRQKCDEGGILDTIENYLQEAKIDVHRVGRNEAPNRMSVVAMKGELKNPDFTLLLYAHVDTVYPRGFPNEWKNPLQLRRDNDTLHGLGVYDMKAGVMEIVDILREVDVPLGIRVVGAFCPDEEGDSIGALDAIAWMKKHGIKPDLVLSPEIATMRKRQEKDSPKDIIVNRVGHVKSLIRLTTPQMHGFDGSAADAGDELLELIAYMKERASTDARQHPNFGKQRERFERKEIRVTRAHGFSNTTAAFLRMSYINFPGHSVSEVIEWERECIDCCAKMRKWNHHSVVELFGQTEGETSYEPYALDLSSEVSQMTLAGVDAVYGGHKLKAGSSTSDANVLVQHFGVPTFDIGPAGSGAHSMNEQVSASSIARNIVFMRHMLTKQIPQYLDAKK